MTNKISKGFRIYVTKINIKGKLVTLVETESNKSLKCIKNSPNVILKSFAIIMVGK